MEAIRIILFIFAVFLAVFGVLFYQRGGLELSIVTFLLAIVFLGVIAAGYGKTR